MQGAASNESSPLVSVQHGRRPLGFSALAQLVILRCDGLTSLSISECPFLVECTIKHCVKLQRLALSAPVLRKLDCSECVQLEELIPEDKCVANFTPHTYVTNMSAEGLECYNTVSYEDVEASKSLCWRGYWAIACG